MANVLYEGRVARDRAPGRGGRGGGGSKKTVCTTSSRPINPHVRRPDVRVCVHVEVAPSRCLRRRSLRLDVNGAAYTRRWSSTITSSSDADTSSAPRIDKSPIEWASVWCVSGSTHHRTHLLIAATSWIVSFDRHQPGRSALAAACVRSRGAR
jgi:hypothetical protein